MTAGTLLTEVGAYGHDSRDSSEQTLLALRALQAARLSAEELVSGGEEAVSRVVSWIEAGRYCRDGRVSFSNGVHQARDAIEQLL